MIISSRSQGSIDEPRFYFLTCTFYAWRKYCGDCKKTDVELSMKLSVVKSPEPNNLFIKFCPHACCWRLWSKPRTKAARPIYYTFRPEWIPVNKKPFWKLSKLNPYFGQNSQLFPNVVEFIFLNRLWALSEHLILKPGVWGTKILRWVHCYIKMIEVQSELSLGQGWNEGVVSNPISFERCPVSSLNRSIDLIKRYTKSCRTVSCCALRNLNLKILPRRGPTFK